MTKNEQNPGHIVPLTNINLHTSFIILLSGVGNSLILTTENMNPNVTSLCLLVKCASTFADSTATLLRNFVATLFYFNFIQHKSGGGGSPSPCAVPDFKRSSKDSWKDVTN